MFSFILLAVIQADHMVRAYVNMCAFSLFEQEKAHKIVYFRVILIDFLAKTVICAFFAYRCCAFSPNCCGQPTPVKYFTASEITGFLTEVRMHQGGGHTDITAKQDGAV